MAVEGGGKDIAPVPVRIAHEAKLDKTPWFTRTLSAK
jgi:hypothetical protein